MEFKIIQEKQLVFNVEMKITEKALQLIMATNGGSTDIRDYYEKLLARNYGIVTSDPSFDLGLGADINDIFSLGLMVLARENNLPIELSDLSLHPFRIRLPKINNLEISQIEGEIIQQEYNYTPITMTICKNNQDKH